MLTYISVKRFFFIISNSVNLMSISLFLIPINILCNIPYWALSRRPVTTHSGVGWEMRYNESNNYQGSKHRCAGNIFEHSFRLHGLKLYSKILLQLSVVNIYGIKLWTNTGLYNLNMVIPLLCKAHIFGTLVARVCLHCQ